jgi:hypothetical protein
MPADSRAMPLLGLGLGALPASGDEFRRAGCEAVFLNHAFGDSPEQQMLLQMQVVFAEYERALITERTRRGAFVLGSPRAGQLGRHANLRLSPVP